MKFAQPFKTGFNPEMSFAGDAWVSGGGGGYVGDDFFVDDLLNLSNEDVEGFLEEEEEEEKDGSASSGEETGRSEILDENSNKSNPKNASVEITDLELVPTSELAVPADDLADLEKWLTHFVEDSVAANSHSLPYTRDTREKRSSRTEKTTPKKAGGFGLEIQVPAKARSKRSRTGGRVWSPLTESSSTNSSSLSSCLIFSSASQKPDLIHRLGKPSSKKQKKRKKLPENNQPQRHCSHCLVQKTPQWRAGPLGAKTLCNACGVRYKSGRLLPEYRPASSPTFSCDVHSNNHRKVLEMRRKKEQNQQLESGLPAHQTC